MNASSFIRGIALSGVFLAIIFSTGVALGQTKKQSPKAAAESDYVEKVEQLYEQKQYDQAVAELDKVITAKPKETTAYILRGEMRLLLKQFDIAQADFDKAIELKPESKDEARTYKNRALAKIGRQDWEAAIVDLNKTIELSPDDAQAFERRGFALRSQKRYPEAIADYNRSLELNPNESETWAKRGYTYSLMQQYDKAIPDYEQALRVNRAAIQANPNVPEDFDTPQRLQYARAQLAYRNRPPTVPTAAATPTPSPTPAAKTWLSPMNIGIAIGVMILILVILKALSMRRGATEVSSTRIR